MPPSPPPGFLPTPTPSPPPPPLYGFPAYLLGLRSRHTVLFAALGIAGYALVALAKGDMEGAGRALLPALGLLATYYHLSGPDTPAPTPPGQPPGPPAGQPQDPQPCSPSRPQR